MARKKQHEKEPNHERWLVSYADFITLLFAVFVTLYAMSQTDKKKVEEIMASMANSFGFTTSSASKAAVIEMGAMNIIPSLQKNTAAPQKRGKSRGSNEDFKQTKRAIEAYLTKAGAQDKVSVSITQRGLVVSLKEAGFFDSGSATLKHSSLALLDDVMGSLSGYSNMLRIEGHTDNVPISSAAFPSNWELSTARATNVLQHLVKQDFEPERMSAAGYGEYHPVADNSNVEGRQKNRRIDIVLISQQNEKEEP
ncbi:Flagellar motor rotation protein MotB [Citrifermentans bremense]|uniref:Flagellar motor rotation protein MotB n=1 Tax=Citrifermentans bremense TaxID=60035 RepID=A0A6S6M5C0_9BACT|nr:flagellar motor protein MotB [Citrifermentans bremense]BCG48880.1 Flagellar motor rotation protein MotB [Citrifermentans bremense]